jgi:hypothetical protein
MEAVNKLKGTAKTWYDSFVSAANVAGPHLRGATGNPFYPKRSEQIATPTNCLWVLQITDLPKITLFMNFTSSICLESTNCEAIVIIDDVQQKLKLYVLDSMELVMDRHFLLI